MTTTDSGAVEVPVALPFTPELEAKIRERVEVLIETEAAYLKTQNVQTVAMLECAQIAVAQADYLCAMLNEIDQLRFALSACKGMEKIMSDRIANVVEDDGR